MKKTKVLLVLESQGGSRRHVVDLIDGLDPERFDLALAYGTSRMDAQFVNDIPRLSHLVRMIPCNRLVRRINPLDDLAAFGQVRRAIREFRPDVVHCHSSKAGIIGRLAAMVERVPLVFYTPHAYSFQAPEFHGVKRSVFVELERWFSRHATTKTFNVSAGERDAALAQRLDDPHKFQVIVNGIPDTPVVTKQEARRMLRMPEQMMDAIVVGVTARMVEQKDPMTFTRIAAQMIKRHPQMYFAYVGDGPYMGELTDYLRAQGVLDHVFLPGYRQDADTIVAAFDVYLLTSLYEGMPYSLIESIHAGVPVVATRVTGNDEVVEPGVNGALFEVGDVDDGVKQLETVMDAHFKPEDIHESYVERFTLDAMVNAVAANYEGRRLKETA
ncbi:exopolysaccharide biosynthesis protein [Bifidobacterium hapali]|uniref:Exopolysaccharide biosynthesis protein n=1 Tax=Bifidobacterium hapali TaxID=1630172 RepID=A0A261G1P2_9BIFI|nr:glycosyltransferase [Bifidobacterium hapali]OZG64906.1 exopolysaccharide biosynthesis protein [Bifidobacterium hapali]